MNDLNPNPSPSVAPSVAQENSIDLKVYLFKFLRYWYFFVISVLIALLVAWLVNRYTKPLYSVSTTVLLEQQSSPLDISYDWWGWYPDLKMIENEKGVLLSHSLIQRVSKVLTFEVSYFGVGRILTSELYDNSPFTVVFDTLSVQPCNVRFNITLNSNLIYTINAEGTDVPTCYYGSDMKQKIKEGLPVISRLNIQGMHHYGEWISDKHYRFKIILNDRFRPESLNQEMFFMFNDPGALAKEYNKFTVEPINKESSIVQITMTGMNPRKTADFLNALTNEYMKRSLDRKNMEATGTIRFIEEQMLGITDSLQLAESNLQRFKQLHKIMDVDVQSQQVLNTMEDLEKQKATLLVNNMYYEYLRDYLRSNNDNLSGLTVPSSMGINDPILTGLITDLTKLYAERSEARLVAREGNPLIASYNQRIETQKRILTENINSILSNSHISIRQINQRISAMGGKINQLPATQRQMFGMERKFKLNDAVYTLLLEKRAEAQITKASNLADNEVIDTADAAWAVPVKPKRSLNYAVALIAGLLLPVGLLLGKDYLNNKLLDRKDIERITNLPILGQVMHSGSDHRLVVAEHPRSFIAESFRQIRTSLQFLTEGNDRMVILVTSCTAGEGKSFTALNLATVFALYGRKTLVMGYDLRKPGLYPDMNLSNTVGITSYLINQSRLDDIIQTTSIDNLHFMAAGPVPPNPAELIASAANDELLERLKQQYDIIILDSPPLGLVTDAHLLMKYAGVNIFVTRQNVTPRPLFESIITDINKYTNGKTGIILNDFDARKSNIGRGYGYGYSSGYDYGYYEG